MVLSSSFRDCLKKYPDIFSGAELEFAGSSFFTFDFHLRGFNSNGSFFMLKEVKIYKLDTLRLLLMLHPISSSTVLQ